MIGIRITSGLKPTLYIGKTWEKRYTIFVIEVSGMIYIYADFLRKIQERLGEKGIQTDLFSQPLHENKPSKVTLDRALEKTSSGYLVTTQKFDPEFLRGEYWVITWGDKDGRSYVVR